MKSVKQDNFKKFKENIYKFYFKHKPVDTRDKIRLVILAIAIPVFIFSSYQLVNKLYTDFSDENQWKTIIDQKPDNEKNPFDDLAVVSEAESNLPYQILKGEDSYLNDDGILKEYQTLWERNNDMIGWISFPGFSPKPINYPIVYSGDNSYYLRRDFDGNDSVAGSIFLDGSNSPYSVDNTVFDKNYVYYGHAMANRSMFGNISDYWTNEKSWENNKIYIDFMNTRLEYEVFSTFVCDPYFNYRQTHFSSDAQYQEYLDMLVAKSVHDFGLTLGIDDRIITLSTCYKKTRRTAIVAKLVRQIVYTKSTHGNTDIKITPIVMPTYMPFKVPTRTPSPTPGPTSGVTPGVTPGVTDSPTVTPVPKELLDLLTDPGLEGGSIDDWSSNPGQVAAAVADPVHKGSYAGFLDNSGEEASFVMRDIKTILIENGPGRYSAEAYLKSFDADANFYFMLYLDILRTPASTSADPEPSPVAETIHYYSESAAVGSSAWSQVGSRS
ncbi:MAG: sortase domain-containing protein, partial [Saccharofermentanales bacterium]